MQISIKMIMDYDLDEAFNCQGNLELKHFSVPYLFKIRILYTKFMLQNWEVNEVNLFTTLCPYFCMLYWST